MDFENKKREGKEMTVEQREKAGLPGVNDNFGVVVLHVGHILDPLQARYKNNLNEIWKPDVYPKTEKVTGAYEDFFELTIDG